MILLMFEQIYVYLYYIGIDDFGLLSLVNFD